MVFSRETESFLCHVSFKVTQYQQGTFSWCFQGRLNLFYVMLVLKSHNQLASSIVFGCLSPSPCTASSLQKFKKMLSFLCFIQS